MLGIFLDVLTSAVATLATSSVAINILLGTKLNKQAILFALVLFTAALDFFIPMVPFISLLVKRPVWTFLIPMWWVTTILLLLLWYGAVTYFAANIIGPKAFRQHFLIWCGLAIIGVGLIGGGIFTDQFMISSRFNNYGPLYFCLPIFVIINLLLAGWVLFQANLRRQHPFDEMVGQGNILRYFFLANLMGLIAAVYVFPVQLLGEQGVTRVNQFLQQYLQPLGLDISWDVEYLPYWPGLMLMMIATIPIMRGLIRSNQIFARQMFKKDWIYRLITIEVLGVTILILCLKDTWNITIAPDYLYTIGMFSILCCYSLFVWVYEYRIRELVTDLEIFAPWNNPVGLLEKDDKYNEQIRQQATQHIFYQLVKLLDLESAALIYNNQPWLWHNLTNFPKKLNLNPLTALNNNGLIHLDNGIVVLYLGSPPIASLVLVHKDNHRDFTFKEEWIARYARDRIVEIWSVSQIIRNLRVHIVQEKDRVNTIIHELKALLHDDVIAQITIATMELNELDSEIKNESTSQLITAVRERLERLEAKARGTLTGMNAKYPEELTRQGLIGALKLLLTDYTSLFGQINFETNTEDEILHPLLTSPRLEYTYAAIDEAIRNAAKHARGQRRHKVNLQVHLDLASDGQLTVLVEDDGIGFDTAKMKETNNFGQTLHKTRMKLIGGVYEVSSTVGQGTTIKINLPIAATTFNLVQA